jgi:hypothetical protein
MATGDAVEIVLRRMKRHERDRMRREPVGDVLRRGNSLISVGIWLIC